MMNEFLIEKLGDYLSYLVSICTVLTAIIPLMAKPSQIYNRRFRKLGIFWMIRRVGYLIMLISGLGIYFNILQNVYNDQKNEKKENALTETLNKNYKSSLDTMRNNYNASSKELLTVVANSLGKYGYKLDSANNKLTKVVRDSSKIKIFIADDPILSLCPEEGIERIQDDKNRYQYIIRFCSQDASSRNFQVECSIVLSDSLDNLKYLGKAQLLDPQARIVKDGSFYSYLYITKTSPHKLVYILLDGTYTNFEGNKKFTIKELYFFNNSNKRFGNIGGETRKRVISRIN